MAQGTPAPRLTAALGPNSRRHDNRTYDPGILRLHPAPHKAAQCGDACLAFSDEGARTCALTTRQTRRGQGIWGFGAYDLRLSQDFFGKDLPGPLAWSPGLEKTVAGMNEIGRTELLTSFHDSTRFAK